MSEVKLTLGRAIDQIVEALSPFEDKDRRAIVGTVCQHLEIDIAVNSEGLVIKLSLPLKVQVNPPRLSPQGERLGMWISKV